MRSDDYAWMVVLYSFIECEDIFDQGFRDRRCDIRFKNTYAFNQIIRVKIHLIPVSGENTEQINENAEELPERTVRFLVTRDLNLLTDIDRRFKNDYAILVDENGVVETYEL